MLTKKRPAATLNHLAESEHKTMMTRKLTQSLTPAQETPPHRYWWRFWFSTTETECVYP
ncbi:MAG: hypothetical protein VX290_03150 [Candidatus Latescibacterota bacterium]|nr:hypothetical protein [Candidatus Latescibacterota bacterium]